jgi:hypothetical protein
MNRFVPPLIVASIVLIVLAARAEEKVRVLPDGRMIVLPSGAPFPGYAPIPAPPGTLPRPGLNPSSPDCGMRYAGHLLPHDDHDPEMAEWWLAWHYRSKPQLGWKGDRMVRWLIYEYERNLWANCYSAEIYSRDIGAVPTKEALHYLRDLPKRFPGRDDMLSASRAGLKVARIKTGTDRKPYLCTPGELPPDTRCECRDGALWWIHKDADERQGQVIVAEILSDQAQVECPEQWQEMP